MNCGKNSSNFVLSTKNNNRLWIKRCKIGYSYINIIHMIRQKLLRYKTGLYCLVFCSVMLELSRATEKKRAIPIKRNS